MKKALPVLLLIALVSAGIFVPAIKNWILNNAGPWHIVMLHFPVGLLVLAWLMEVTHRMGKLGITKEAVRFVLAFGVLGAVVATFTGLVLQDTGGYESELVEWHQRLGIATAASGILVFLLHFSNRKLLYFLLFTANVILLTITGHYGGSVTHGEDFLTENLTNFDNPDGSSKKFVPFEEVVIWDDMIEPIFKAKCKSCHNPSKQKGGLVLTDSAAIAKGGEKGSIFAPNSEGNLCDVLHLPLEDELHMPPDGKSQLTPEELMIICWWAKAKGPYQKNLATLELEPEAEEAFREYFAAPDPIDLLDIEMVSPAVLAELNEQGIHVNQADPNRPWLAVNLSDRKDVDDAIFAALDDIQDQVTHLDLGNTNLTEEALDWAAECEQLQELKLDLCTIPNNGLEKLTDFKHLKQMNLYGATIEGAGVDVLSSIATLERLYLWRSNAEEANISTLSSQLAALDIQATDPAVGFPKQQIVPPYFTQESPFLKVGSPFPLACKYPTAEVRFTLDGSDPTEASPLFTEATVFDKTCRIKARAFLDGWIPSEVAQTTFVKAREEILQIKKISKPSPSYTGAGENGLTDGRIGEGLISDEQWMGYFGEDCSIVFDLGEEEALEGVAIHVMEDVKSWVFFPSHIQIEAGSSMNNLAVVGQEDFNRTTELQEVKMDVFRVPAEGNGSLRAHYH